MTIDEIFNELRSAVFRQYKPCNYHNFLPERTGIKKRRLMNIINYHRGDDITIKELSAIALALDCDLQITFTSKN